MVFDWEAPTIGGPDKGELKTYRIGCRCEDYEIGESYREAHAKSRIMRYFKQHSIVNPKLENATFENYQPHYNGLYQPNLEENKRFMESYAENFSKKSENLFLFGDPGLGKSHLSVSLVKHVINQMKADGEYHSAIFINVPSMLDRIRSTYSGTDVTEAELMDTYCKADLLVMDDIGMETRRYDKHGNCWTDDKLFAIMDARQGRPTIYTSNHNLLELEKRFSKRMFSRINDDLEPLKFTGKDYRMEKRRRSEG